MSNTSIIPAPAIAIFAGLVSSASPSLAGPCRQGTSLPGGIYSQYNITAPILIKSSGGILVTIACTTTGNITLHDCASAAASCAGNLIGTFVMTTGLAPLKIDWPCSYGIYVSAVSAGLFSISFT